MLTKILLIILGCSIGPVILSEIMLTIIDMIRKNSFNDPQKRRAKGLKSTDMFEPKRPEFTRKLHEALTDNRLLSKKSEKRNKWGIAIDPGPAAMTWKKLYLIIIAAGSIIGILGALMSQPVVMVAGIIIGMMWCPIAIKQGAAKMNAEKDIYDTIFIVVKQHMGIDPAAQPRDVIKIQEWTTPEEPQLIADGRTKASEEGELEEFEKQMPKKDKKGKTIQPKIAEFRTTPLSMQVTFPATFREAGTDDTLMHLNEAFGHVTEWVAERDVPDEKHQGQMKTISGWDFPGHTAYLRTVPPLPTMAMFPVDFDKGGSWNQIKLGRTVSGEAFWDLKVTPMALVPLSVDTMIWRRTTNTTTDGGDDTDKDAIRTADNNDYMNSQSDDYDSNMQAYNDNNANIESLKQPDTIGALYSYETVRLDAIRKGDIILSEMGVETEVESLTEKHTPDEMFRISFIDEKHERRRIFTVKAAGNHIWPVDMNATAHSAQSGNYDINESIREMTSLEIYEAVRNGVNPVLAPIYANGRMINWRVYSISYIEPSEVMCMKVNDPTHTFMIATKYDDINDADIKHEYTHSEAMSMAIPTHNCGSPLTLDTVITKADGSETTMMDVKPGDVLMGSDDKPTMVKSVSRIMEPEHLYELTLEPDDNE